MSRYVAKVTYEYDRVDGRMVQVGKTVHCHDRLGKLVDLWDFMKFFIMNALLPACCIVSIGIGVGVVITLLSKVW